MTRKYRDPAFRGCDRHKGCTDYGHCVCGGKASGPHGLCITCSYPMCTTCGRPSGSPKALCKRHRYGTCECGCVANGAHGRCSSCFYGACLLCGGRSNVPSRRCASCRSRLLDEKCTVLICENPQGASGSRNNLCHAHASRLRKFGDAYDEIPISHRVPEIWEDRRSTVYVAMNCYDEPIYVGSAFGDGEARHQWHRRNQSWATEIDRFVVHSEHPTRGAAYDAERALIAELSKTHTLYNKVWNTRPKE